VGKYKGRPAGTARPEEFLRMTKSVLMVSAALALLPLPALAQDAASEEESVGVADIVVTAQRRAENVQDVPIAISAFSSDQLAAQGITNTLQLGQYVPNLFAFNNTGLGSANGYYLRGLGNTESIATFDPPVGTYVDDVYLSRQNANNLSFLDVERVEVLRGPQGTLFGRNTTGGAIAVIMRDPGEEFGGYIEAGYGRFNRTLFRGSIDVPLGENFGVKVSGYIDDDQGYVQNTTTNQRINDNDSWGARIGFKGDFGGISWKGSYSRLIANGENVLNFTCDPANPTNCNGRFATTGLREAGDLGTSPFAPLAITGRKANFGAGNRTTTDLVTSNIGIELGSDLTLNLITGYVNLGQRFALDFFDGRGGPGIANGGLPPLARFARGGFTITNDGRHKQFTQEVKLAGSIADGFVDFVGGLYYINEKNTTDFADIFSLSPTFALLLADRTLRNKTEAWAGYLQADVNLSDQITLTAGIRYTDEEKTFVINDNRASCNDGTIEATCLVNANMVLNPPVVTATTIVPQVQNAKVWTPRVALNFKPNDDMLIFASATRGFKSGGWNARGTAAGELLPFDPEKVWSYEAGIKSDLFDRRVRANITFFYQDTSALQTPSAFIRANGSIAFITQNFADYENKGIELELTFAPAEGLNLFLNAGYQDDKYKIDRGAPALNKYGVRSVAAQQALCLAELASGRVSGGPNTANCGAGIITPTGQIADPVRTPKWTLAVGGSYRLPLSDDWSVTPSVNASYAASTETGTNNLSIFAGSVTGTNGTFPANLTGQGPFVTGSFSEAHWIVNSGITVKGPDDRLSIGIECNNCFGEEFISSTLSNYSYLNMPMTWLIRTKYSF
jgi:iron complex outermembrane recepter protein